jgi:hypothetical protein
MAVNIGEIPISNIYIGDTPVSAVYIGAIQVYP